MPTPKVTVLMAVHNGEKHVRDSIDSILAQSFDDFEFLIINDASTDQSRDLILSYYDQRIRIVDNEANLGLTRSLNRGMQLASGEWIARQDADDISERDRLARQTAFLKSNPDTALVGSWYKKINNQSAELGLRQLPCTWLEIRWALLFLCPFVHSSVMLRKDRVLNKIGLYDETFVYGQDYDLWSRVASQLKVANIPEYLVRYRVGPSSMTSTYGGIVQDEAQRTSIGNLAALIGIDEAIGLVHAEAEFSNMSALLFGDYRRLTSQEAIAASRRICWLLHAFLQQVKTDCRENQLETEVRIRTGRRLVDIGNRRPDESLDLLYQLTLEALRLYWPLVFKWRSLRVFFSLMKRQFVRRQTAVRG